MHTGEDTEKEKKKKKKYIYIFNKKEKGYSDKIESEEEDRPGSTTDNIKTTGFWLLVLKGSGE